MHYPILPYYNKHSKASDAASQGETCLFLLLGSITRPLLKNLQRCHFVLFLLLSFTFKCCWKICYVVTLQFVQCICFECYVCFCGYYITQCCYRNCSNCFRTSHATKCTAKYMLKSVLTCVCQNQPLQCKRFQWAYVTHEGYEFEWGDTEIN